MFTPTVGVGRLAFGMRPEIYAQVLTPPSPLPPLPQLAQGWPTPGAQLGQPLQEKPPSDTPPHIRLQPLPAPAAGAHNRRPLRFTNEVGVPVEQADIIPQPHRCQATPGWTDGEDALKPASAKHHKADPISTAWPSCNVSVAGTEAPPHPPLTSTAAATAACLNHVRHICR